MEEKAKQDFMDQFLDELLKVAIERIKESKPWEEHERKEAVTVDKVGAAKYLGVSESTINNLLKDNKIPCIRPTGLGGRVYFRLNSLDKWMTSLEEESLKSIEDKAFGNGFDYKVS